MRTHAQQRTLFTQLWLHSFGLLMNQTSPPLAERRAEQESPASAAHGATQSLGSPATMLQQPQGRMETDQINLH